MCSLLHSRYYNNHVSCLALSRHTTNTNVVNAERLNSNVLHLLENNVNSQGDWHFINTRKDVEKVRGDLK